MRWSDALRRGASLSWPLLQASLAASLAWAIALSIAEHPDPFFAPVAAVVALLAPQGERGLQAARMLLGVVLGIVVGEVTVAVIGESYGSLGLAAFVATVCARAAGGARITVIQAGAGAILTVIAADGDAGAARLVDALIGGGVAIVFSQILFSPEPVAMLRRAQTDALQGITRGLSLTAQALERNDPQMADKALSFLRRLRDPLGELARLRRASRTIARSSAGWRVQMAPAAREREIARQLDFLGASCMMLARAAFAPDFTERSLLAPRIRELAETLATVAQEPSNHEVRQQAAVRALEVARSVVSPSPPSHSATIAAIVMLRFVAMDIVVFAGADSNDVAAAADHSRTDLSVHRPPPTPLIPFGLDRWTRRFPQGPSSHQPPNRHADSSDLDAEG